MCHHRSSALAFTGAHTFLSAFAFCLLPFAFCMGLHSLNVTMSQCHNCKGVRTVLALTSRLATRYGRYIQPVSIALSCARAQMYTDTHALAHTHTHTHTHTRTHTHAHAHTRARARVRDCAIFVTTVTIAEEEEGQRRKHLPA